MQLLVVLLAFLIRVILEQCGLDFAFFWLPTYLNLDTFFPLNVDKNGNFWTTCPPHLVLIVIDRHHHEDFYSSQQIKEYTIVHPGLFAIFLFFSHTKYKSYIHIMIQSLWFLRMVMNSISVKKILELEIFLKASFGQIVFIDLFQLGFLFNVLIPYKTVTNLIKLLVFTSTI